MQHVAICASGLWLIVSDCELISAAGVSLIVVNSGWLAAQKCQFIYAGDLSWLDKSISNINVDVEKWTCNTHAVRHYGLNFFDTDTSGTFNSGEARESLCSQFVRQKYHPDWL